MQKHSVLVMAVMAGFMMSSMATAKDLSLNNLVENQKGLGGTCGKDEQAKVTRAEVITDKQVAKLTQGQGFPVKKGKKYLVTYGDPKKKWQFNISPGPIQDDLTSEMVSEKLKGNIECFVDPDTL